MRLLCFVLQGVGTNGFIIEKLGNFMNQRFVIIFSTFLICSLLAVVVNVIYRIDIVYTHLFYIPIILTGIWYPRYAGFLAAALGLIHISCEYATLGAFKIGSFLRAVMFMVVANVISYLTLRQDRLLNSLRESEEATEQARLSAEAANKAKSQFLANMSHEIRTPLNGILGMAELCLKTEINEDQKHIVGTITKEANSLLVIINEILDFSKIEAGKLEIEQIPFDLRNLFEDVAESFLFQTTPKGLELISSISPETPTRIVGDPGRLRQVLRNLIGNGESSIPRG